MPPRVNDRSFTRANHVAVPDPRGWVDGLAHATQQANAREVVLLWNRGAEFHERANRGRSGVENGNLVLLNELPPAARVRCVGGSFEHQLRRPIGKRPVNHVRVAGDPAHISGAPVDIGLRLDVENVLVCVRGLGQVAARGVQNSLGSAGCATRIQNEQRLLSGESLGNVLGFGGGHGVVPPDVATFFPGHIILAAANDKHIGHGCSAAVFFDSSVDRWLESEHLSLAPSAVGCHNNLCFGVIDAAAQAVCAESSKDDRVHCAESGNGQHGDHGLGNHRQVDGDAVTHTHTKTSQHVCGLLDISSQLGVRDVSTVAGLTLPVDGDPVTVAVFHVAVETVICDVEFAIVKPLCDGGLAPVEGARKRLMPAHEVACLLRPKTEAVCTGLGIERRISVGLSSEICPRREAQVFGLRAVEGIAHGWLLAVSSWRDTGSDFLHYRFLESAESFVAFHCARPGVQQTLIERS